MKKSTQLTLKQPSKDQSDYNNRQRQRHFVCFAILFSFFINMDTHAQWTPSGPNVYTNGNVGVGTSFTDYRLNVRGTAYSFDTEAGFKFANRNPTITPVYLDPAYPPVYVTTNSTWTWYAQDQIARLNVVDDEGYWPTNKDVLYATTAGRIGIGTSNPQKDLHVVGALVVSKSRTTSPLSTASLEIQNTAAVIAKFKNNAASGDLTSVIDVENGGGSLWRYGVSGAGNGLGVGNGTFYFENSGRAIMTMTDRCIGMGTISPDPTYYLSVNGSIRAKSIRVNSGWADYVFDDSYKLRPLSEVGEYIKSHKHLPDVPTAAEVEQEGVDVAETQVILLKKVEELTLYILQQQAEIESLKKRVGNN